MNGKITHEDLLLGHAAGRLPAPLALLVRTQLALSAEARKRYALYAALAGVLLERLEPARLRADAWERLERAIDRVEPAAPEARHAGDPRVPPPLRRYAPRGFERLPWRKFGPLYEVELPVRGDGFRTRLIRLGPGAGVPRHTHAGHELTLVIEGSFRDAQGLHRRGDLVIADPSVEHAPVAEEECLCLWVADAPLKLTGPLGRLLNPFLRI
ncbi:MAG: ChrR family anti-sigma-E factor [Geminicoccaceae bacterium]|nr:ChrR family anti-sigma-E factor [Geminicoccaceae bacterium]